MSLSRLCNSSARINTGNNFNILNSSENNRLTIGGENSTIKGQLLNISWYEQKIFNSYFDLNQAFFLTF